MGTLVLAKTPPSWPVAAEVRRSLPEPCASVEVVQLASGFLVALPAADRQAKLATGRCGGERHRSGRAVYGVVVERLVEQHRPRREALGADTVTSTATALISSVAATARDTMRRADWVKDIYCLLSRFVALTSSDLAVGACDF